MFFWAVVLAAKSAMATTIPGIKCRKFWWLWVCHIRRDLRTFPKISMPQTLVAFPLTIYVILKKFGGTPTVGTCEQKPCEAPSGFLAPLATAQAMSPLDFKGHSTLWSFDIMETLLVQLDDLAIFRLGMLILVKDKKSYGNSRFMFHEMIYYPYPISS